ncbi:phage major tail protein, TP901-1 family [Bacillus idriensis]|uniref:Phage major tail protein, TP901-1 family n=1 Tax=Metabacillus idriensis TaxID=324768 RepID=A0A6I2ME58_9BACI|nr:phage major tail protein, TP901-1 family [Metabacillus idriensis]MRX54701.1 phage major tail protein, TP901-1 family [Metabacillus idriensis]
MAKGVNFLLFVNTGTDAVPTWTKVAGQKGGTLTREYDTIDVTSKDNMGWNDEEYGNASWSIEADGLLVEDDAGFLALEAAFEGAEYVKVRFQTQAGNNYEGSAIISDFSVEAPYDDSATYSLTLNGKGAYTKTVTP